jgi:hypothetical protein
LKFNTIEIPFFSYKHAPSFKIFIELFSKNINLKTFVVLHIKGPIMNTVKIIGLTLIIGGCFGFLVYGLYQLLKEIDSINPILLLLILLILIGIVILLLSVIVDRINEKNYIDEQDLKP